MCAAAGSKHQSRGGARAVRVQCLRASMFLNMSTSGKQNSLARVPQTAILP